MPDRQRGTVALIAGTRPEAIKLAPLVLRLISESHIEPFLALTGQHPALARAALAEFCIEPDLDLELGPVKSSMWQFVSAAADRLATALRQCVPDYVVVQGDTASTLAGAVAGKMAGVPVAHVEAGLRSGDLSNPYPEEGIRRMVTGLADLHFAPTISAVHNLRQASIPANRVHLVGNTVVDAIRLLTGKGKSSCNDTGFNVERPTSAKCSSTRHVLITLHRRESRARFRAILKGVGSFARRRNLEALLIAHPSHELSLKRFAESLSIAYRAPASYGSFIELMRNAELVVSDSGGVQEECTALGIRLVVARTTTERNESLDYPYVVYGGTAADAIEAACRSVCTSGARRPGEFRPTTFGDGTSSQRIVRVMSADIDLRRLSRADYNRNERSDRRTARIKAPKFASR